MRIVVSGTHASGKTTLIDDFTAAHPGFAVFPDPFETSDAAPDELDAPVFYAQLRIAAARLLEAAPGTRFIAERGPLDFLAYLDALEALGRAGREPELFRLGAGITARAMTRVDLLVVLPLTASAPIEVHDSEDPELRLAMDDALRELADDPDLIGDVRVIEIAGTRAARLAQLDAAVRAG